MQTVRMLTVHPQLRPQRVRFTCSFNRLSLHAVSVCGLGAHFTGAFSRRQSEGDDQSGPFRRHRDGGAGVGHAWVTGCDHVLTRREWPANRRETLIGYVVSAKAVLYKQL